MLATAVVTVQAGTLDVILPVPSIHNDRAFINIAVCRLSTPLIVSFELPRPACFVLPFSFVWPLQGQNSDDFFFLVVAGELMGMLELIAANLPKSSRMLIMQHDG